MPGTPAAARTPSGLVPVTVLADTAFDFPGPEIYARFEKDLGPLEGGQFAWGLRTAWAHTIGKPRVRDELSHHALLERPETYLQTVASFLNEHD